jgi:hypothetical protein
MQDYLKLESRTGLRFNRTSPPQLVVVHHPKAADSKRTYGCIMVERDRKVPSKLIDTIIPTAHDVVMGRGKSNDLLPGNVSFRRLISSHRPAYQVADSQRKRGIAETVMGKVIDSGGRFLKANNKFDKASGFSVISIRQALEKIMQALREKQSKTPRRKYELPSPEAASNAELILEAATHLLQLKKYATVFSPEPKEPSNANAKTESVVPLLHESSVCGARHNESLSSTTTACNVVEVVVEVATQLLTLHKSVSPINTTEAMRGNSMDVIDNDRYSVNNRTASLPSSGVFPTVP